MGLFTKKPGGTGFGNFLRGIGGAISNQIGMPGALGSGQNMIPLGGTMTNKEYAAQTTSASTGTSNMIPYSSPASNLPFSGSGSSPGDNNNLLLYAGIGLAAILLLKKK